MPKTVPFSFPLAKKIVTEYNLPKYYLDNFRSRGIPGLYFEETNKASLLITGIVYTRSIFFWKTRLELSTEDIARAMGCSCSVISNWVTGTRQINAEKLAELSMYLQQEANKKELIMYEFPPTANANARKRSGKNGS